mmetsp:Transcript_36992/g.48703  ORF Transcript_36992/g.48703 Transcript_36992/m.48703 type:complete len:294 (-) Transcript_36992:260-1141(-)
MLSFKLLLAIFLSTTIWNFTYGFVQNPGQNIQRSVRDLHLFNQRARYVQSRSIVMMGRRSEKIARKKGAEDAKRGKVFARIGKKIIMAVKSGGSDVESNKQLADVMKEAKAYNVPKDNIDRAIKRAEAADTADFKEAVYEAYGYGGVGIIINCLTDNTNRALTEIKQAIKKSEVSLASTGSVAFNFDKKGRIEVDAVLDDDIVLEIALEGGVDDYELAEGNEEGSSVIYVPPAETKLMADALEAAGHTPKPSLANVPNVWVQCSEEDEEENLNIIEAIEALDDVDSVEHNIEL